MSPGDDRDRDAHPAAPAASPTDRSAIRARIFTAITNRDFDQAALFAQYLARISPVHADDLTVAALAWACKGELVAARRLLDQALELDPHQKMAAMTLARVAPPLTASALRALRWHTESDPAVIDLLVSHVVATGEPQGYVVARTVRCLLPPLARHAALRWRHLTLAEIHLEPSDQVRQIALPVPGPLRGIVDPTLFVDGIALPQGPFPASLLAAPRLAAVTQVMNPSLWHVQAMDRAAPDRPVALQLRNGDQIIGRHICVPVTNYAVTGLEDIPATPIEIPAGTENPVLYADLTGEPIGPPPPVGADDGIVDVIIPVHGDFDATQSCFTALLTQDPGTPMRVIAIDDASPDPRISAMLDDLARGRRIALVRNPTNLGFVRSVNIGMALHHGRDLVLLNADTVVAAGWLGRLRQAALASTETGTVTPWSNDATICSYPAANQPTPLAGLDIAALDRLAASTLSGHTIRLPTAVGFCMYIRRPCLAQTGWFDADTFGIGYGEENDFCLRATAQGWQHRMALNVFVGHVGGGSFGTAKQARIQSALRVLERLYPGYGEEVQSFIATDPLRTARRIFDLARLRDLSEQWPLLILCASLGGGTDRFIRTQIDQAQVQGRRALILRPEKQGDIVTLRLEVPDRLDFPNLVYDPRVELPQLRDDLNDMGVATLELHHAMNLPPSLLLELASWFPNHAYIHDYGWICPRYTLIDGSGRYCGEPQDTKICDQCVADHGDLMGLGIPVAEWRAIAGRVLAAAQSVTCSSADTARRMGRYVPTARFKLLPAEAAHTPPSAIMAPARSSTSEPLRVLVPGAIGPSKGYDVLLACAHDAAHRQLPLQWQVLGYSMDDAALLETGRVVISGQYREEEVPALMAQLRPHMAFLPSVWPETWCYALTHVMAAGLFIAAFDLGAQAERLRQRGHAMLLPIHAAAPAINDALLQSAASFTPDQLGLHVPAHYNDADSPTRYSPDQE
ncbi:hypothetical protein CHU95_20650 [Niveispirillum lacus]|uniref:Glycosyltransferase 2-like domain-containing protein n=1 Tax=Niveispirillum lacus TaxID=1981099 RepID=A0A255YS53_9PROT|nr:hypothetical protein CHU95_20650 [Niveispirillum lacus]